MTEDRCVCCGEIIPEGTMVCENCKKLDETIYIEKGRRNCGITMRLKQLYKKMSGDKV